MIDSRNPYTPGAGMTPKYLAGRDEVLSYAQTQLEALSMGYQCRSIVYYGLRGVGKTVLLNEIEQMAENRNLLCQHIEVQETGTFLKLLIVAVNGFLRELSIGEATRIQLEKVLSVLKHFSASWNLEDKTLSVSMNDTKDFPVATVKDLSVDLTDLFVSLGRYAKSKETAICFCVDEIQYAKTEELEALICAIHRLNQLDLPILFFFAGLPKILKSMGDAKSYAERLFRFIEIDTLTEDAARDAIEIPAKDIGVAFTAEAVDELLTQTKGYPYFIQEACNTIWENCSEKTISLVDVQKNIAEIFKKLDASFFHVRYSRCTDMEQRFLIAMAQCEQIPCEIAKVAAHMERKATAIGPFRAQLVNKGLIYASSHGKIDFTVPQFDAFLRRTHPDYFSLTK